MAQRSSRLDSQDPGIMRSLRSMGSGTDVLSMSTKSSKATLPYARPQPAYVSDSEAEKLIYAEIERPARVSESALSLVNGFLDQILYDILSRAHSVSLGAIRSAVPIVLKQRLGHSAVSVADEELQDYLDEDEMEEIQSAVTVLDPRTDFDVDLSWKLTRLRCMVYAKLGDMEEEDEEDYLEDDDLREHVGRVEDSVRIAAAITPSAAIFVTSILEFLAEQALCIAAQHARKRHLHHKAQNQADSMDATRQQDQDVILLEEIDMSGVGKEGPLIRLWRSWKGSLRVGGSMSSRPTTPSILSPTAPDSPAREWRFPSVPPISTIQEERSPSIRPTESPLPAEIPLPISDNDVEEIEVPGLAPTLEGGDDENPGGRPLLEKRRPSSMLIMPGNFPDTVSPPAGEKLAAERPLWARQRSQSLPASSQPAAGIYLRQVEQEATAENSREGVIHTRHSSEDLGGLIQSAREESNANSMSNSIDNTVATIAGALSIEASRGYRRGHPSYVQPATDSETAALAAGASARTEDDPDTIAGGRGPHNDSTGESHEAGVDPEELALSSGDEREIPEEDRTNPRDSGFGVVGSEDELPAHDETTTATEQGSMAVDDGHEENHHHDAVQDPSASNEAEVVRLGTAAIFYQGTGGINGQRSPESSSSKQPEQSDIPVPTSTRTNENQAGAMTSSAWPVVIRDRKSSLEGKASTQSPTQRSFPNHVSSQRHAAEEPIDHAQQDGAPRYATSFATSRDGYDQGQVPPAGNTSVGKDGRPSTAGRQHVRLRPDVDDGSWRRTPPDEMDRAKKSLDVLIDSDETLRLTLTPKSARSANEKPKVRSQTQELADFFRNTAPPGAEATRPKSSRSSRSAKDTIEKAHASTKIPLPSTVKSISAHSNHQQPVSSPPRPKNPLGEPRDPRMARTSTRDLADYARSTGPENAMQLPKPLAPRQGVRTGGPNGANSEAAEREDLTATSSGKPVHRLKYQARDARAPRTAESSELIDFIREGPPRPPGDHRIDRNVAPFRTTMDSDDLNALAPRPEVDGKGRSSVGSAQESAITVKSMPSSLNSRTGLLDSTNRTSNKFPNGTGSSVQSVTRQPVIPEADGIPKRTRRKVRDPYAIDFSDEEDDMDESFAPQQRRAEEESLVDFLRNTAPPPGMTTQPILAAVPDSGKSHPSVMLKRSTSSSKLRDYFQGSISGRNGASLKTTNGARAESPHLTQVGSKMDKYRPTQPTHAAHVERNRQKMRVEPRDATVTNGGDTADLAAYLKNSGPAPGSEMPPQKFNLGGKDHAGFMRIFQKRGSVKKRPNDGF